MKINFSKRDWIIIGSVLLAIIVLVVSIILIDNAVEGNKIDKIILSKAPDKTTYGLNQEPEYEGVWLQVVKKNGKFEVVDDISLMTFSGFDSSKENENLTITVEYEGFTTSFKVKIVDDAPKPKPIISRIYLETLPSKLTYTVNDSLDVTGGVIVREYTDGSKVRVNLMVKDVTGFKTAKESGAGEYDLTVTYEDLETGIIKTTTYTITITE